MAQECGERTVAEYHGEAVPQLGASVLGDAYQALGVAHAALGRPEDARRMLAQARQVFESVEHHYQWATTAAFELQDVAIPYLADQPAVRRQLRTQAEQAWTRSSGVWAGLSPALARLPLLLLSAQWAEARKTALEASAAEGIINQRLLAARVIGPLALYRGETDLAWAQVMTVLPAGPASEPGDTWLSTALELQLVAAQLAIASGNTLPRVPGWRHTTAGLPGVGRCWVGRRGTWGWAGYLRATAVPEHAAERATQALECAATPRQPLALLAAHRTLGQLDAAANRLEAARTHLEASLSLARSCAAPYEEALTMLSVAELCIAEREIDNAAALLNKAAAVLDPLGAQAALRQLAGLRVMLGQVATTPAYPAGLSAREVEVLRLVAEGLSSAEVAEARAQSTHCRAAPALHLQQAGRLVARSGNTVRGAAPPWRLGFLRRRPQSDGSSVQQGTLRYRRI